MVIGGEPWKENSLSFQNVDNGKDDDGHFLFLFFVSFFHFLCVPVSKGSALAHKSNYRQSGGNYFTL
jgi:hypothetical protein